MNGNHFSHKITVFHERTAPEEGFLVGYGALLYAYNLTVPIPARLALISLKHKQYETDQWLVFTPRYRPEDNWFDHLVFAQKYEGIDLFILKKLFEQLPIEEVQLAVSSEPTGQYSRKLWFLYEWLMEANLNLSDLVTGNYIDVVDTTLQYGCQPIPSKRHRVRNNLPGVKDFCPMIRKTPLLEKFISLDLPGQAKALFGKVHGDVMARTSAFLLLKDSKASYAIEGERPPLNRVQRWGRAIGQAGLHAITKEELLRLQQIVIDNPRFTKLGWRIQGGFIGEHDRRDGSPLPDHISARWQDLSTLLDGLIAANRKLDADPSFDAVLAAAMLAFGFVFIHPFVDGNGRIHRYLIHHVLLRKNYVARGVIFPVSAIILDQIDNYREVLEAYSIPRLDLIEWQVTTDNNVEVLNETIDIYRYFDATKQAEFLYSCVQETIEKTIPEEVSYLEKFDRMKSYLDNEFDMPDKTIALLIRFLEQGEGKLSARARTKEFSALTLEEVQLIEEKYLEIFGR
jgi:Fic family protein